MGREERGTQGRSKQGTLYSAKGWQARPTSGHQVTFLGSKVTKRSPEINSALGHQAGSAGHLDPDKILESLASLCQGRVLVGWLWSAASVEKC